MYDVGVVNGFVLLEGNGPGHVRTCVLLSSKWFASRPIATSASLRSCFSCLPFSIKFNAVFHSQFSALHFFNFKIEMDGTKAWKVLKNWEIKRGALEWAIWWQDDANQNKIEAAWRVVFWFSHMTRPWYFFFKEKNDEKCPCPFLKTFVFLFIFRLDQISQRLSRDLANFINEATGREELARKYAGQVINYVPAFNNSSINSSSSLGFLHRTGPWGGCSGGGHRKIGAALSASNQGRRGNKTQKKTSGPT